MDVIRTYVKGAFAGVAQTPEAVEQQQELITNMEEKVADLVAEGKGEQEALGITIAEAGDLSALASEFPPAEPFVYTPPTVDVRASQLRLLSRIGGVIFAMTALLLLSALVGNSDRLDSRAFLLIIVATAVGVWRIWQALFEYRGDPDRIDTVPLVDNKPVWIELLRYVGVCFAAAALNAALGGTGYWAWVLWMAALALPADVVLRRVLVHLRIVTIEPADGGEAASEAPSEPRGVVSAAL